VAPQQIDHPGQGLGRGVFASQQHPIGELETLLFAYDILAAK
jgi:hypothetical protein